MARREGGGRVATQRGDQWRHAVDGRIRHRRPQHPHDRSRPERYGVHVGGVQRAALRETAEARDAAAEYFRLFRGGEVNSGRSQSELTSSAVPCKAGGFVGPRKLAWVRIPCDTSVIVGSTRSSAARMSAEAAGSGASCGQCLRNTPSRSSSAGRSGSTAASPSSDVSGRGSAVSYQV